MKKKLFLIIILAGMTMCMHTYGAAPNPISKQEKNKVPKDELKIFHKDVTYVYTEHCCDGTDFTVVDVWHFPDDPEGDVTIDHHEIGSPCPVCPPAE